MSTDRLLTTVLQAYQKESDSQQINRILSTTTSLLTTLSNPLNVTLLTSQLLVAPAIWNRPDGLAICLRIISIFNTAAITVQRFELESSQSVQPQQGGGISCDDWATAVVKGADEKSPRWKHLLVIGGVLLGMEAQGRQGVSTGLRLTLENALVTATNLALVDPARDGILGAESIVLTLNHTFELLSNGIRGLLNYDLLAPLLIHVMLGTEGYHGAYFIGAVDTDVRPAPNNQFEFSARSPSFFNLQRVASKPLITSMGPLSRLVAHSITHLQDSSQISIILDDLMAFTSTLATQWRRNKLSELDPTEVDVFLTQETSRVTFPVLWQLLKSAMFATTVILRSIIGRSLVDPVLASDVAIPSIASRSLHILRNIYFISSRLGVNAFSAYTFVFLTSIDLLSRFPTQSKIFLTEIRPTQPGHIPTHPLDRNLDLYFLNTSENFTLVLSPNDNDALIVTAANPYLNPTAHRNLLEIFEAAHSAMLAVLAAPQNSNLTSKLTPFYAEALFKSFPANLSPRQFRFAFKTLLRITTPPAPLSETHPLLPDTLLELLRYRAQHAPGTPLPPSVVIKSEADGSSTANTPPMSEQGVLTLTLLDSLPYLPIYSLEEWLPLAADLINLIEDNFQRETCKARFWDVLQNGEMDIERAALCVAWWSSRGGREMVLFAREGKQGTGPFMSGGLAARGASQL